VRNSSISSRIRILVPRCGSSHFPRQCADFGSAPQNVVHHVATAQGVRDVPVATRRGVGRGLRTKGRTSISRIICCSALGSRLPTGDTIAVCPLERRDRRPGPSPAVEGQSSSCRGPLLRGSQTLSRLLRDTVRVVRRHARAAMRRTGRSADTRSGVRRSEKAGKRSASEPPSTADPCEPKSQPAAHRSSIVPRACPVDPIGQPVLTLVDMSRRLTAPTPKYGARRVLPCSSRFGRAVA